MKVKRLGPKVIIPLSRLIWKDVRRKDWLGVYVGVKIFFREVLP